jgi:hypothetical protein
MGTSLHAHPVGPCKDELLAREQSWGTTPSQKTTSTASTASCASSSTSRPRWRWWSTRPKDLTREQLREVRLLLDEHGYSEANLQTAWRNRSNQDIAASIIGYIRQAALGEALLPFEQRVPRPCSASSLTRLDAGAAQMAGPPGQATAPRSGDRPAPSSTAPSPPTAAPSSSTSCSAASWTGAGRPGHPPVAPQRMTDPDSARHGPTARTVSTPGARCSAVPHRGTRMGNRGILHLGQHVVRPWAHKAWVHCVLDASSRSASPSAPTPIQRAVLPGRGHRAGRRPPALPHLPAGQRHVLFNTLWTQANLGDCGGRGRAPHRAGGHHRRHPACRTHRPRQGQAHHRCECHRRQPARPAPCSPMPAAPGWYGQQAGQPGRAGRLPALVVQRLRPGRAAAARHQVQVLTPAVHRPHPARRLPAAGAPQRHSNLTEPTRPP